MLLSVLAEPFHTPPQHTRSFPSSTPGSMLFSGALILTLTVGVGWYLVAVTFSFFKLCVFILLNRGSSSYIPNINSLAGSLQLFLHFSRLSLRSTEGALWCTELFNSDVVRFMSFLLLTVLLVSYPRNHHQIQHPGALPYAVRQTFIP